MADVRWFDNEDSSLRATWQPIGQVVDFAGNGPHAVRLAGTDWALFSGEEGWAMVPDRCPHRLAPLSAGCVDDGLLRCAYHGWAFDTDGVCVEIPALGTAARLPPSSTIGAAHAVTEAHGLVWVALDEPLAPLPAVPDFDDPHLGMVRLPTSSWHASAAQMADNFLDVAHFPFLHLGTIGDPDDVEVHDFTVERSGMTFTSTHRHSSQLLDGSGTLVERVMEFECTAPHHVRLRLDYGQDSRTVLLFFMQPVDIDETRLFCIELTTDLDPNTEPTPDRVGAVADFQTAVALEDKALLEQLGSKAVPLGTGAEVHTRADRSTLELRRMLQDLVTAHADATSAGD